MTEVWIRRGFGLLPALLLASLPAMALGDDALTGIHVSGVGEVRVVPDMARLTLEVRREGTDAAQLKTQIDEVTAAVLELAKRLGIPERHVTAAAVNVYPRYRPGGKDSEPNGIVASRTVEVTVDDLGRLGDLINGALERGANGVRSVQLDASNRAELENLALEAAIDDARAEARRMADHFDVDLGPLRDASAGSHQAQPMLRVTAMEASAPARDAFSPGEMTIRRDVQATFGIRH